MTWEHIHIGQRSTDVHSYIDPDRSIHTRSLGLVVVDQLNEDTRWSLHDAHYLDHGSIITPRVLAPPEPTDAFDFHIAILAIESGFLVQRLKRLHPTLIRLKSRKPATLQEEALERSVEPNQRRILTPAVELSKPLIVTTKDRQGSTLVVQTDARSRLLITVDPFLQRAVV